MTTIDKLDLKTTMSFEKAEELCKLLNSKPDDMLYETVPTLDVGQYAIACFTLSGSDIVRFEGFL